MSEAKKYATFNLYLSFLDIATTHSTRLGCSTKNILNPYCTREWWNALFSLKPGVSTL